MGCATTSVKIISIIINAVYVLSALVAIGWIAFNADLMSKDFVNFTFTTCSIIVLFALLCIFAAICESAVLTKTSAIFILVLIIIQIACTYWVPHLHKFRNPYMAWQTSDMDILQQTFKCCGKIGAMDYVELNEMVPLSCYLNFQRTSDNLFDKGCNAKISSFYENEKEHLFVVSCLLIASEIIRCAFAAILVLRFNKKQRSMKC
ncbi:protein late bloomer-like [Drosophila willistoni]|uniref:protein late bloomer-like n=1 Tax=Drosophila willistoni TaxID=7260 RepID=UPI000C26D0ED|nr:protein late bloomer-like [Drosophila willistoni]XP_046866144.1 protein late bloomer-like [Drosophila willistoni]